MSFEFSQDEDPPMQSVLQTSLCIMSRFQNIGNVPWPLPVTATPCLELFQSITIDYFICILKLQLLE